MYHETIICRYTVRFFGHPPRHYLQLPLSALRATFPKGDSILSEPSRKQRMRVASPSGSLLCQQRMRSQSLRRNLALATDVRGVPSGEAVAPATEGAPALIDISARCKPSSFACLSHLSPFATPIACRFPFRPCGPLSPKGTAFFRYRHASNGCARRPLRGSCRASD